MPAHLSGARPITMKGRSVSQQSNSPDLEPLPSDQDATGRTLGDAEIEAVTAALRSGTLTSTKGTFTGRFEAAFAILASASNAIACASGSAAVHCAVAAVDPEPGDEIITTSITDMGALSPILYQGAIPVFCDVDALTGNVTAETIAARISERTVAIIVTHLFGNACVMEPILALAARHDLPVIEDCAQAFLATDELDRPVGTIGAVGAFSFQQGKHVTTGEGGIVVTNDPALHRRVRMFVNKAWPYGEANPDHEFLALNYRLTELQGAVGLAQLDKLAWSVERRRVAAAELTSRLEEMALPGITIPAAALGATHSWWKYCPLVDGSVIPGGAPAVGAALRARGIASAPRYIQKPAFRCRVFTEQNTFGHSRWPFTLARPEALDWSEAHFPGTFAYLDQVLVLPWNERYEAHHVERIASAIAAAVVEVTA